MKIRIVLTIIIIITMNTIKSQNQDLPYYEIPDYPEDYNQGTVIARMLDGLGFRYF